MNATTYRLVALGGAVGSVARAWAGVTMVRLVGTGFPWGTMLINVVGSAITGIVAASALSPGRTLLTREMRDFLMVGVCGGFTTFSSFSLQTFELLRDGRAAAALANIVLSVVLCVIGTAAGYLGPAALLQRLAVGIRQSGLGNRRPHHDVVEGIRCGGRGRMKYFRKILVLGESA